MHRTAALTRHLTLALIGGYLLAPTALVIVLSFEVGDMLRFPPTLFSLRWYEEFFTDPEWIDAAKRTMIIAISAASLATVVGTMASYVIVRSHLPGKNWLEWLSIAPLVVPPIVLAAGGYALYLKFGLQGSYLGLTTMHAVLGLPFVILVVTAALRQADPNIELASMSMGADRWLTFRKVTFPTILPALLTGALFAFMASFDEVVVTVFLVGTLGPTLPVRIFASLVLAVSPVVAAISVLQIAISIAVLLQIGYLRGRLASVTAHGKQPAMGAGPA